jgi:hypothetical protein
MANPMQAKYTKQMSAMVMPATGGEIGAWAETLGKPHSEVMRELIDAGLKVKRKEWARAVGLLDPGLLDAHVQRCTRQGGKQLDRRRDYDDNRRGRTEPASEVA